MTAPGVSEGEGLPLSPSVTRIGLLRQWDVGRNTKFSVLPPQHVFSSISTPTSLGAPSSREPPPQLQG